MKCLNLNQGFLYDAIQNGKTVIFDSINEASSTVCERLNGLLDKKNNENEEFFKVKIQNNLKLKFILILE